MKRFSAARCFQVDKRLYFDDRDEETPPKTLVFADSDVWTSEEGECVDFLPTQVILRSACHEHGSARREEAWALFISRFF